MNEGGTFTDSGQTLGGKLPGEAARDTQTLMNVGDWLPGTGEVTAAADVDEGVQVPAAVGRELRHRVPALGDQVPQVLR